MSRGSFGIVLQVALIKPTEKKVRSRVLAAARRSPPQPAAARRSPPQPAAAHRIEPQPVAARVTIGAKQNICSVKGGVL